MMVSGSVPQPDEPHTQTLRDRGREAARFLPNVIQAMQGQPATVIARDQETSSTLGPARFIRRKVGERWVVELRGDIVDIGPGKRQAGRKARAWNRAVPPANR
jgi:hypothetical protein